MNCNEDPAYEPHITNRQERVIRCFQREFRYTFKARCDEDNKIILQDGAVRIFYNCKYKGGDIPQNLRDLFDYIETGESNGNLTRKIDEAVHEARMKEE